MFYKFDEQHRPIALISHDRLLSTDIGTVDIVTVAVVIFTRCSL